MGPHAASNSHTQSTAEKVAVGILAKTLNLPTLEQQRRFDLGVAAAVVDGFAETATEVVLLEVNARVDSKMKPATRNKVLKDTLKLLPIEKTHADKWRGKRVRKILVFLDPIALASFGPKAWVTEAWKAFGVETHVVEVPEPHKSDLIAAQKAQDLIEQLSTPATSDGPE